MQNNFDYFSLSRVKTENIRFLQRLQFDSQKLHEVLDTPSVPNNFQNQSQ